MAKWRSGYDASQIGKGTGFQDEGFDTSQFGSSSAGDKGTYSWEISLALIFWDEMRRYQSSINPPVFDGGMILEVTKGAKYSFKKTAKTKLQGTGETVMIEIGSSSNIKKGMYALVLCKSSNSGGTKSYTIISAKNVGSSTDDDPSEYSV